MHDLEYAVGIGCWVSLVYLVGVYKFGNITPIAAVATPMITIFITYILIILIQILVKILFWLLNTMFSPEVILLIAGVLLVGLFGHIIHETSIMIREIEVKPDVVD